VLTPAASRVLVIDDDESLREMPGEALTQRGFLYGSSAALTLAK
jgi:DNA-binding response OmpR family regulator